MQPKLDHEFYETVIMYNMLTDEPYLASIIDHLDKKFFEDKNISEIVGYSPWVLPQKKCCTNIDWDKELLNYTRTQRKF